MSKLKLILIGLTVFLFTSVGCYKTTESPVKIIECPICHTNIRVN